MPLATLLSGGLDSSVITAVAARAYEAAGDPPVETYSFDYTDNEKYFKPSSFQPDADWPWVERMREAFGTRHGADLPHSGTHAGLIPAMNARDLPGMADVDSSLLWFCRQIRRRNTVVISGECADEIFGGYPWFHRPEMLHAETFPWSMDFSARTEVLRGEVVRRWSWRTMPGFAAAPPGRRRRSWTEKSGEEACRRGSAGSICSGLCKICWRICLHNNEQRIRPTLDKPSQREDGLSCTTLTR